MKKNDRSNIKESNSFALFGDDSLVSMGNDHINNTDKKVQEVKTSGKAEQIGSQSANEKPESVERGASQSGYKAKRGFRSLKINKDDIVTEGCSSYVEGQSDQKVDGGNNGSGCKQQRRNKTDNGSDNKAGRNKQKVQKCKGGIGVHEGVDSSCETVIDYKSYKLREFDVTNKIKNYIITGKPRKTKDDFIVEVIIDGFRYKVSSWSIKGNQYIQGLDSNFLVRKYKVNKK